VSLESLLHHLGHLDVDYEYLVQEHLDDLSLILLIVGLNLDELLHDCVLGADDLLIFSLSLVLLVPVALIELLEEAI
jgi:hypothetical protein